MPRITPPVHRVRHTRPGAWRLPLLVFLLAWLPVAAHAQLAQMLIVANQTRTINRALADGKGVLIARKTVFDPMTDIGEQPSVMGGDYRPPLTYWLHRGTGTALVLGGYDSEEGRGKLLTPEYHFFILEPGLYDLAGYVRKTRRTSTMQGVRPSATPARSSLGFVGYSTTTLPAIQSYTAWVPPSAAGTTFDGETITEWYEPGYYQDRARLVADDALLIDMRGIVPNAADGEGNIASFLLEAGQIAVVSDFRMKFEHGDCDVPAPGHWVCALETLDFAMPFVPQQQDAQQAMLATGYKAKLVQKVSTALLVPGRLFADRPMALATDLRTTRGEPYAEFSATTR